MNIAYITTDFGVPVFGYKGASIHVREMVRAMRREGHNVHIISPAMHRGKDDEKNSNFGEEGIDATAAYEIVIPPPEAELPDDPQLGKLTCVSVLPTPLHVSIIRELRQVDKLLEADTRLRHEIRNLLYNKALYDAIDGYLAAENIDFVYERYALFSMTGIRLARKLGVPHVLEVNAPLAFEQERMRGLEMKHFALQMEKQIFQSTDRVLVVSDELGEFVKSCGVNSDQIEVVPNAVDPARFDIPENGDSVRETLGLQDKTVAGFVGSLKNWHGTETLLRAFLQVHTDLPDLHLLIVGDGPERENLEKLAAHSGISQRVTFTGKVTYGEIPRYLAAMDIAAAPYIPHDNFYFSPIKIFEYMAMGIATIGAKIGQVKSIVHHGETGMLFEPGNVNQLVHLLTTLTTDTRLRERLGKNAKTWVLKERTWQNNARKVVGIVKSLKA